MTMCAKKEYKLSEITGLYYRYYNGVTYKDCRINLDSLNFSLTGNCIYLNSIVSTEFHVNNNLLSLKPVGRNYYTSFKIIEKKGKLFLYKPVEENQELYFVKVDDDG